MTSQPQTSQTQPVRENRLAHETSPYLLQHRTNPVDWWPWGPDALAEARRSNKPILLSVGYAACHWCHVMAHESFEDEQTASVMNELFVNIKVDREERPDIDQIYMSALHLLGEQGGWPMTMFLTPDGAPVWGGTYFPKTSRYGRPAFVDVLREFVRLFRDEPQRIEHNRQALMQRLAARVHAEGRVVIGAGELDAAAGRIADMIDPINGGLRGAPKFPQAALFELLWRAGERTGEERFFAAVDLTLDRICRGGIYDHLAGGFARYSVDERWLVPHFEKMLYDNAQLLELLALAWARSGKAVYRDCATRTVDWLHAEMTTPQGAFSASLDADSEGEEGKFYVWTFQDIETLLGPEHAAFFATHYDVSPQGNFEGQNILNRLKHVPQTCDEEHRLAQLRARLHAARSTRVRPGLDDKVLADWNGLTIAALVRAGSIFAEPSWVEMAARAFQFIAAAMTVQDRLGHSWRDSRLLFPGLASDFAAMIKAALALFEATGEHTYLAHATAWQAALERHYADPDTGGYFLAADDADGLFVRPASIADDATPNPNAITAMNLVRLAVLASDERFRQRADGLFDRLLPLAAENLFAHAALLNALDFRLRALEIVVTGRSPTAAALTQAALKLPLTSRIVLRAPDVAALPAAHPARDKIAVAPEGAAFVCAGARCSPPVTDPEGLTAALTSASSG